MSFHNKPHYQIPELIEALKAHRLPHDTPGQLADSFRIGWMACRELAQADSVLEDAARLDFIERHPEMSLRHRKGRWAFLGFTNYEYDLHQSLREAIDAAMLEEKV